MYGKVRMLELTIYGLVGLAAILVVAFYFAYDDEFPSAGETSQFNLINNADLNDSKSIEPGMGSAQFRGTVVKRESWPNVAP
jgi:hypothetical protein